MGIDPALRSTARLRDGVVLAIGQAAKSENMNTMPNPMRNHHAKKIGFSLLIVALIVGMTGCAYGSAGPVRYDLTIASAEGGAVDTPGEGTFTCDAGRVVDLVATPTIGYRFVNWTGDVDTIDNPYAASTAITVNDDYSITANFEQTEGPYYTLTIAITGLGSTSPTEGQHTYSLGEVVPISASPASGYRFDRWTGDVSTIPDDEDPTTTITINNNYSITAHFVAEGPPVPPDEYTLTISSTAGGYVSTPGEGTFTRDAGTVVTLVAIAYSGYQFDRWTGDVDTIADDEDPTTTIIMNDNYHITANFGESPPVPPGQYSLTISSTAGGYVSTPGEGTFTRDAGTAVTLVAIAYSGYQFDKWTGDVDTIADDEDPTTTITMNDNYFITAHFVETGATFMIAAGGYHTVGLRGDGTVLATGYSGDGQCDVGLWDNIIEIAAGDLHTVGLMSDHTVVAVGDNSNGQCSVGLWQNIIQIAAGGYHTVGLRSDGTVLATGDNSKGQCNVGSWRGIEQVAAGIYHTVGLKSNGTVVAVGYNDHGQCNVGGWTDIIQVAAGLYHTVGLKANGRVVAAGDNGTGQCGVGGWTGVIQVSAGWFHTVGTRSDGTAVAAGPNWHGLSDVGSWRDIIQVSAGRQHTVGLKSDGTVVAVGYNDTGQCDTTGWHLI
jgi:hypothetical protein